MKRVGKMRLLHMGCGESLKVRGLDGDRLSLKLTNSTAEQGDEPKQTIRKQEAIKPGDQRN